MPKRKSLNKSTGCPEPINTLLDIAGAAAMGTYAKHKIKKDYARGEGEASAKAASIVLGMGAMRSGSEGLVNLGGLIGINSAIKDIEKAEVSRQQNMSIPASVHHYSEPHASEAKVVPKFAWRQYCEDGSPYGISPFDYQTADDYDEALQAAKLVVVDKEDDTLEAPLSPEDTVDSFEKHLWRRYCLDGKPYGLDPNDFESADDYEEAIEEAKEKLEGRN